MRKVIILARGFLVPDEHGGDLADVALGHAKRSLAEFAVALDAFEEDALGLRRAADAQSALIEATQHEVRVQTPEGEETQVRCFLPEEFQEAIVYWQARQVMHGKAGVLALDQLRRALSDFARQCSLPVASAAVQAFNDALPGLRPIRNSVSHANERAAGGRPWLRHRPEGTVFLSDLLSNRGYCQGSKFFMRLAEEPVDIGVVEMSETTLNAAHAVVQTLVDSVPWRHQHDEPKPLMTPLRA